MFYYPSQLEKKTNTTFINTLRPTHLLQSTIRSHQFIIILNFPIDLKKIAKSKYFYYLCKHFFQKKKKKKHNNKL